MTHARRECLSVFGRCARTRPPRQKRYLYLQILADILCAPLSEIPSLTEPEAQAVIIISVYFQHVGGIGGCNMEH